MTMQQDTKLHPRASASGRYVDREFTPASIDLTAEPARLSNYTKVRESETTIWHFDDNDDLHRVNGPAIERDGGPIHYFVRGTEIFPPDDTGFDLASVAEDGVQRWTSGTGNRECMVGADGSRTFYRDGDIHRNGAPAIIDADGTEHWYRYDKEIASPWPAPATVTIDEASGTTTTIGSRYDETLEATAVARSIRSDIDHGIDTGILPDLDYSVHTIRSRGDAVRTIQVEVNGLPRQFVVRDGEPTDQPFHSDEMLAILRPLESFGESRNKVTTDNGTDSASRSFHFTVSVPTR